MTIVGLNFGPESTGIAPYTGGLARELASRSWRVRVLSGFPHYPQWRFAERHPPRSRISVEDGVMVVRRRHRLPSKPGGVARALSELSFGVAAICTRFAKPDVVVLVSPALISSAAALVKARLVTRRPVVVWVQDLYTLGLRELGVGRPGLSSRLIGAIEKWTLRSADAVVVIHERFRDTVVEELGVRPASVEVVRNWSHLDDDWQVDRDASRAALGWDSSEFVVLHAGNMGVKQGLENVVDAARLAAATGSRVRFVLLGDGNQRSTLAELAAGVANVEMIASLPDDEFRDALASADALLVNERAGVAGMAVPSKLTSYFSTGLPVIAATDPGSVTESEVLLAGAGPVVPAGDPQALLDAAVALAGDAQRARAMGASGRRFRTERLTAAASFDTFAQLLETLARGRRSTATRESGTA
ncbi:glycosyltransferase family 4 protein [Curtobacterium sp. ODYSSEY 48 V2]|uniref:glycosyltransferase family 4 protein n=1 Tax=Curtobacterium sp. ODYSSEY 48 V2 TaxID=2939561 RepID=UPI002041C7C3|nr:glycosyltransferase family 4 protein [Curtobacterium sp. ODYSSEY 48 V2]MCM3505965.1 glycosyltransferase family 4 protein [Curtobacterium sp. ODYSSEY 48 V2]